MMRRFSLFLWVFLAIGSLTVSGFSQGNKFRSDDPLKVDPDQLPIPEPQEIELSQTMDLLENTFALRPDKDVPAAENVNTLGEVPDSSWFANRMSQRVMSIEELVRGPDQLDGPDQSEPWVIIDLKTEGITPGFTMRDGRDEVYFVKFDPPKYPQLATSTEVIATKFFYAFGYHVAENYLSFIRRQDLRISPDARLEDEEGKERPVRELDIDNIFRWAYQESDGTTPVIASRRLPGGPVGHFKYYGTRSDDPNDIFPHQNRRELRGLRVFSAWLNHDDSRSMDPGEGFVQHYLLDFGSTLGSGSVKPQTRRAGNEYIIERAPIAKAGLTLGIWDRPWRHVKYPDYPAIGRFEADFFQPQLWKPEYPNPAFERMQLEDAFWATRIVLRFTDEMIRAIVDTGQISDPEANDYLVETLIKRRDKIIRYYLPQMNPLDDFRWTGEPGLSLRLAFKNLGLAAGLASTSSYQYQWFRFDNLSQGLEPLSEVRPSAEPSLAVPQSPAAYLMVRINTSNREQPQWRKKVEVFIRNDSQKPTVVGIHREQ
jgi:hypothetical protein